MSSRRRVAAVVVVVAAAGCSRGVARRAAATTNSTTTTTGAPTNVASEPLQNFSDAPEDGIGFAHPRAWHEQRYVFSTSFSDLVVYLSNAQLRAPYTTTVSRGALRTRGRNPISKLPPGGVLVSWSLIGGWHEGSEIPHPNATIGGQPADIEFDRHPAVVMPVQRGTFCATLGSDLSITADIRSPIGGHFEMIACLRGPNLARDEILVHDMLASTRFTA